MTRYNFIGISEDETQVISGTMHVGAQQEKQLINQAPIEYVLRESLLNYNLYNKEKI